MCYYFIANQERFEKLASNRSSIMVYVPPNNVVGDEDSELIAIAKSSYSFDEERHKIIKIDC